MKLTERQFQVRVRANELLAAWLRGTTEGGRTATLEDIRAVWDAAKETAEAEEGSNGHLAESRRG